MARKKKDTAAEASPEGPADLAHMDSVSPEGGYAGLESERDAAEAALLKGEPEAS